MIQKTKRRPRRRASHSSSGNDRLDAILLQLDNDRCDQGLASLLVGVAGNHRGCGASTIAGRLAVRAAEMKLGSVLLMDANVTHPNQHRLFGVNLEPGLSDILYDDADSEDVLQETAVDDLWLMSAGAHRGSGAPSPVVMKRCMERLRDSFQMVFIDLQPINNVSPTLFLSRLADGVVFVVDAKSSLSGKVADSMQILRDWDVYVFGSVLNRTTRTLPRWIDRWL